MAPHDGAARSRRLMFALLNAAEAVADAREGGRRSSDTRSRAAAAGRRSRALRGAPPEPPEGELWNLLASWDPD